VQRQETNSGKGGEKRKCLVGLIAVIVGRSTAHPADLAEFLALISGENFKWSRIWIDKSAVVIVIVVAISVIGSLRIGMKGGTI
jgi:choline-glycine betaine transporter